MSKLFKILLMGFISISTVILFSLIVKGGIGNPIAFQTSHDVKLEGPFESTNSNSRYALTESIVERGSFLFDDEQARFSAPDLVYNNGKFFSIFTPGVSIVGVPFYIIGDKFGLPQLFTYFSTHLFVFLNVVLITLFVVKLGGKKYHGILAGLVYLFGTNALSYGLTFTQHHLSTVVILLGLLNALGKRTFINNILFGAIFGAGILMDIPNAFLLLPVALYALYKNFETENLNEKIKISIKTGIVGLILGLMPFLMFYGWYNYQTSGSYAGVAQFIGRSDYPPQIEKLQAKDIKVEEKKSQTKLIETPFDTRLQLNGLYVLLFSNERGIFYYSPILLIGILGLIIIVKNKQYETGAILISSVVGVNIVLYSMFGDPWGGWAFGSRYLIPTAALLSIGVGIATQRLSRSPVFAIVFGSLLIYSVFISFAGALTTSAIPPKVEAVNLVTPIPYTYEYNFQFINKSESSSLMYNFLFGKFIDLRSFLYLLSAWAIGLIILVYGWIVFAKGKTK